MSTHAQCVAPGLIIRERLESLPQVSAVFLSESRNRFRVLVVLESKDYQVQRIVHGVEVELLERFPDSTFDFSIVPLSGRKLSDVVTPTGELLFEKKIA